MNAIIPDDKPKSWIVFLLLLVIGMVVFLPVAVVGLTFEWMPMFLAGLGGIAATWIPAAFMGFLFAAGLAAGHYRDLEPHPWREQVW